MSPASWPRDDPREERMLVLQLGAHGARATEDAHVKDLPRFLARGDLLVVNDAATLPASLAGRTASGAAIELRLVARLTDTEWTAVLFGAGDFHTRTEDRPAPPAVVDGDRLSFGDTLTARVLARSAISPRLVTIAFDTTGAALWTALYHVGRVIQYAHVASPLELWHAQTPFGTRPWAVELPSAARPLAWSILRELDRAGVERATVTHAAGLSSTGDPRIDAALPLPERYDVPRSTVAAVTRTKARGGRVVAVGTTVVRALEGAARANGGVLRAGEGVTDLRLDERHVRRVVDGVLTGIHDPAASHFSLLAAFASRARLREAHAHAEASGYLAHEFGDSCLLLPERGARDQPRSTAR